MRNLEKIFDSLTRPKDKKAYLRRWLIIFSMFWLVYIMSILALSLLFVYQVNGAFFAIPTVLSILFSLTIYIFELKKPHDVKEHIHDSYSIYSFCGICLIAGALIVSLSFICLVLQQRGVLQLENLHTFLICLSIHFVVPVCCGAVLALSNIMVLIVLLFTSFSKDAFPTVGWNINNFDFFCYAFIASIFSAAMIALTYLRHGATGMIALPIVVSVIIQSMFFTCMIIPNYLDKVLERGNNNTKYPLGWLPFKTLGVMLSATFIIAGVFACLQYGFDIVIFSSLPEFFAFLFIPNLVMLLAISASSINNCLGFSNEINYAEYFAQRGIEVSQGAPNTGVNRENAAFPGEKSGTSPGGAYIANASPVGTGIYNDLQRFSIRHGHFQCFSRRAGNVTVSAGFTSIASASIAPKIAVAVTTATNAIGCISSFVIAPNGQNETAQGIKYAADYTIRCRYFQCYFSGQGNTIATKLA